VQEILAALSAQHDALGALLAPLDEAGWRRATPCEGWTVADVVLHLAQTDEIAVASAQGRFGDTLTRVAADLSQAGPVGSVDDGAAMMVAHERGAPGTAVYDRWSAGAAALRDELARCEPGTRVDWVAGQLSVRTLVTTRLAECWIHTGDVEVALGHQPVSTDRLRHIARLAWRTLPYAFSGAGLELAGPVAFRLVGPDGEAWDFEPDGEPVTVVSGDALELCLVAGRRLAGPASSLHAEGPDAAAVLDLVRTYA
jgi:uncharacterized protein (TIGR03084 family)